MPEITFQANIGTLYTYSSAGVSTNTEQGMMAGTSPSITALAGGGWVIAFQANIGTLYTYSSAGVSTNTNLGMMAGTSPSICALPGGGYVVAFQANTGVLGINSNGTPSKWADTNLGMMAGTSPSICALPGGGYVVAFQANTGVLGINSNGTPSKWADTNLGMMAGTSPSICALPGGGYVVAFQANTGVLGINSNGTPSKWADTNLGMMAGTSPSICALPGGGYVVAFQANTGVLGINSNGTPSNWADTNQGMMARTSPSITSLAGGRWVITFQANIGTLYTYSSAGVSTNTEQGMMAGTSSAVIASVWPGVADVRLSNWGISDSPTSTGWLYTPVLFQPTDSSGISDAIIQAEDAGQKVRAVGSGFSFSEASFPQTSPLSAAQIAEDIRTRNLADLWAHAGYTIDISGCNHSLQDRLASLLLADVDGSLLYFTEAGITIHDLNDQLDRLADPLALKTMGGSDGQTIAGAISTGTHGADFDRGPLADSVRAIYLVGAGGVHHWVEPSDAITDPANVQAAFPSIAAVNVHYDDDLFRSALVSVGAMGVVYALILDIVPQYALAQLNLWTTWESVWPRAAEGEIFADALMDPAFRAQLDAMFPGNLSPQYRALQIVVNPIRNSDGITHNCYVTTRFEIPLSQIPASMSLPSGPASGNISGVTQDVIKHAILQQPECGPVQELAFATADISGGTQLEQLQSLIDFCKSEGYYWAVRAAIDCIMQLVFPTSVQVDVPDPQVNRGFEIMANNVLGQDLAMQVVSTEAFFPYDVAVGFVIRMLATFDAGLAENVYPGGYLSLRACGPTVALLGMEQFGKLPFDPENPQCTGAVEMSLKLNADDIGVTQQFETMALTEEPQHGNLHWGQSNGLLTSAEVQSGYAGLGTWITSQAQLGRQTFVNEFMTRCGLV